MTEIATLPISTKITAIRTALEREKRMRDRVLRGDSRTRGIEEMNQCLRFLNDIEDSIKHG